MYYPSTLRTSIRSPLSILSHLPTALFRLLPSWSTRKSSIMPCPGCQNDHPLAHSRGTGQEHSRGFACVSPSPRSAAFHYQPLQPPDRPSQTRTARTRSPLEGGWGCFLIHIFPWIVARRHRTPLLDSPLQGRP
jgi:hypothetical protein